MHFIARIIIMFVCAWMVPTAFAGDPPDPWSDLRPTNAVRCLVDLRAPLDAQPDDQRLLGLAISAYVVLCFNAHPELDGAFGPWLDHARALIVRRRAARAQAPAPTLDVAAPELWVRLIDGDAVGVVAELDRFPAEADSPHALALRSLATYDWRPLVKVNVPHVLVNYARMVLFHRVGGYVVADRDLDLIDPYVVNRSSWIDNYDPQRVSVLPAQAVAGIGWLLRSRQLDDATVRSEAGELLAALGATVDPAASRAQLYAQIERHAATMAYDNAKAFAVAERIALAHCDAEQGVRGKDGHHLLVGLGDMAQWVRSRLLDAAFFSYVGVWKSTHYGDSRKFTERDRVFGEPLRQLLPDAVLTAHVSIGLTDPGFHNQDEASPASATELLAKAITAERARPHPLPDRQLAWVVAKLAKRRADLAQPIVVDILARWPTVDGLPARTGLRELLRAAWRCDVEHDLAQIAGAVDRRNPADVSMHTLAALFAADEHFLTWDGLTPTKSWNEPTIDCRKHTFPHLTVGGDFAVTWQGWLKIEAPGRYEFQVISDGYFKAAIADLVLAERQNTLLSNGLVVRTVSRSRAWSAGWMPLRLDYEHRGDGAECRLLWKPPGAADFTAIPAALLAHGANHEPGLEARALEQRHAPMAFAQLTGLAPAVFTWAATIPWHIRMQTALGISASKHGQYRQLIPLLRAIMAVNPLQRAGRLISCLLLQSGAELDEGLALLRKHNVDAWDWDLPYMRLLTSQLRDAHRLADFTDARAGKWIEAQRENLYMRTLIALNIGDFAQAQQRLPAVVAENSFWIVDGELRPLCILHLALSRMLAQPVPDFALLRKRFGSVPNDRGYQTAVACLGGVLDQPVIAALSARDQDLVRFAAALLELCEGNHAQAQPLFAALATNKNTDPSIAELCRDLLAWYATQTPDTLAVVPKAAPIKRRVTAGAKTGVDDF